MELTHIAALLLALLALLHSTLGEREVLRPLLALDWRTQIPRPAMDRLLRFAWHLTSIAWLGLAASVAGAELVDVTAWVCAFSGGLVFVMLRGHLAWPMFLLASGLLWQTTGRWPLGAWMLQGLVVVAGCVALVAAVLHIYWAAGGRRGFEAALPDPPPGKRGWVPGPLACLAVAAVLLCWATLLGWVAWGQPPAWARVGLWVSVFVLGLRALGNGKQVGFSKQDHSSRFARRDDALYSPLVVLMLFAALAGLA